VIRARRSTWVLALTAAVPMWACAKSSPYRQVWVPSPDLACRHDADCTIRTEEMDCCCSCSPCQSNVAPFALSQRANEVWNQRCSGVECTMDYCDDPQAPRASDFEAVCVNNVCERRAKR